jgi:hypothetical protein
MQKKYLDILKEQKSNVQEKFNAKGHSMKINAQQARNMLGRNFDTSIKSMEMAINQNAKKLTDSKPRTSVTDIYLTFGGQGEGPGIAIHMQGKLKSGALNISAFSPIKIGSFKIRPIETVGNIS